MNHSTFHFSSGILLILCLCFSWTPAHSRHHSGALSHSAKARASSGVQRASLKKVAVKPERKSQQQEHTPDMQKALKHVEQSEYFICHQQADHTLQSPNRAHNMRFTYKANGFEAKPRVDSCATWHIAFELKGLYRGDQLVSGAKQEAQNKITNNRLVYAQEGYEVEYINNKDGMRQNFIVHQRPSGSEALSIQMDVQSENLQLACNNNELSGTQGGMALYYYKDLKVYDAHQKPLAASMQLSGNTLALVVNDKDASYPITIDPLSTTAAAIVESNQTIANFGLSAATAGDVNGDGYSDVIVGAYSYDNGQNDEGAAFVYHGSASGISTTAAAIVESNQVFARMGISVASAGDVNGDGYSDVIVGAIFYDNGQTNEGAAFVYHGSASGISTTAAATVESNQASAGMGYSVASAGDVNGDGYSDVIVGAFSYDNGQTDEGAAFVYHGSASGISTTAAATVESNLASAGMGRSVASARDVNGDGYSDVIVGAYYYANGQPFEGAAFVYHGSAVGISTTAAWQVESNQAYAQMGCSVASAGDVNGDGYSDVIVGANLYDNGQNDEGAAFVYHGSAPAVSLTPVISSFTPGTACAGVSSFTITGSNFNGATSVTIGGTAVSSYTVTTNLSIEATVGSGTTGTVAVTTPNGTGTSTGTFTVHVASTGSSSATACDIYTWTGDTYTTSGTYVKTFMNAVGCDSLHTLNLTVNYSNSSNTNLTICSHELPYTWNGLTFAAAGTQTAILTNSVSCDSSATLNLNVTPSTTLGTSSVTACISYTWNGNTYTNSGTYIHLVSGCDITVLYLTITHEIVLQARALLQGAYDPNTGMMHDSLRTKGLIPTLEPYTASPYLKPGILEFSGEMENTPMITTGPDAIVDWVFLELRDATDPSIIHSTRRALIQRDGDIVSHEDGVSPVRFYQTPPGNYYVGLKHRNHLGVMSAGTLSFPYCTPVVLDFSNPATPVYVKPSITTNPPRSVTGSVALLWAGDANYNKNTKHNGISNDRSTVLDAIGGLSMINVIIDNVYRVEDVNLNGKIAYNGPDNDRSVILSAVGVSTPNNVRNQHTID